MDLIAKYLKEDYLTCPICYEVFKEPKALSCLHNFCEACLETLLDKSSENKELNCPICRENTPLTEQKVSGLKTNFIFKDIIQKLSGCTESSSRRLCSFCILGCKEVEATHKCLTCMDLLCKFCTNKRHTFTRQTAEHKVVPLNDYFAGKYKGHKNTDTPCEEHREKLRFYCQECSLPICGECALGKHRFHEYVSLSEAKDIFLKDIDGVLQSSKSKIETTKEIQKKLVSKCDKLNVHGCSLRKMINQAYEETVRKLDLNRKIVEEEIRKYIHQERETIESLLQENLRCEEGLTQAISFCENTISNGSDLEVVLFREEMKSHLQKYQNLQEKGSLQSVPHQSLKIKVQEEINVFELERTFVDKETLDNEYDIPIDSIGLATSIKSKTEYKIDEDKWEAKDTERNKTETSYFSIPVQMPKFLKTYNLSKVKNFRAKIYTCVVWIDEISFVLVDENNHEVVIVKTEGEKVEFKRHKVKNLVTVAKFDRYLACKTQYGDVIIYSYPDMKFERKFNRAYAVASSSSELIWVTKEKIMIFKTDSLIEKKVLDEEGKPFNFLRPFHACYLPNKSLAVIDRNEECLFFLDSNCQIFNRYACAGICGLCCDDQNCVYTTCFGGKHISVMNKDGKLLRRISLECILWKPRCLSVLNENRVLVTNKDTVVLISLEQSINVVKATN
ncbi:protein PML-like [Saccostrea echinata]|uniref:protein PML-like n=1 Tax=Saccostrea echinata TaxID=191078 RepID=UPI002A7FBDBA|nr:protein PML-like [Saccostrea echinata]